MKLPRYETVASVYLLKAETVHTAYNVANLGRCKLSLGLFSLYVFVINAISQSYCDTKMVWGLLFMVHQPQCTNIV